MSRRLLYLLLILVALPLLMLGGLQWWLSGRFTRESIAAMLAEGRSCEVAVEGVSLSVFSFPSKVEITGLTMTPAAGAATSGTAADTGISMKSLRLEVSVWSLLFGELNVNRAFLDSVEVKGVKAARGGNTLRRMLGRPDAQTAAADTPSLLEDADEWPAGAPEQEKPLNISELPISSSLREARITRVSWTLRDDRKRTLTQLRDLDVTLSGMTLNPADPSAGGSASVRATARFTLDRQSVNLRTLDFLLGLNGKYTLFDPQSGDLNTDFDFQLTIKKGSILNRLPTLVKLNERLAKLKKSTGLDLEVPAEATLLADAPLSARLKDGTITLSEDFLMPFDTCEVGLTKKSLLSVRTEEHQFTGHLAASETYSTKAVGGIEKYLTGKSPELAKLVNRTVFQSLIGPDKRLRIPFESKGELSQPDIKAGEKLEDSLKDALKEAGTDLLEDALKGGDDVEDIFKSLKKELRGK